MFIPIPVLIVSFAVGLLIFGVMRLRAEGDNDPLEDVGADLRRDPVMPTTPAEVEAQARALARSGDKIAAIKLVRETTGMDLRDSKDFVDRL